MKIYIYTDGSHLKFKSGRLGCGGVMVDEKKQKIISEFSEEINPDWLEKNLGTKIVSNPTAEMIGALWALEKFEIPKNAEVVILADYMGVQAWNQGVWKIKEAHIQKVRDLIKKVISDKKLDGRLKFDWVKGHQSKKNIDPDAVWNNYVDKLAKGENG